MTIPAPLSDEDERAFDEGIDYRPADIQEGDDLWEALIALRSEIASLGDKVDATYEMMAALLRTSRGASPTMLTHLGDILRRQVP